MKSAINSYRINKYILSGDYVCSDPQNNIFLLCKHDQINNNVFHKNIILYGIIFPIEVVLTQQQKFRSFPLSNQLTHLLVKVQSFQFSEYQIIKIIKKIFQVMKTAIVVEDIKDQLLGVLNLDNIWIQNNEIKIIWHPRSGKQTYEDQKFLSKIGVIAYYLFTGKNYTNFKDLQLVNNKIIYSLIYNLIFNKEESLKIQFIQEFFQQILAIKSKKKRNNQYDFKSESGQKKIGSIKLEYLNRYKQAVLPKSFITPFRTQRQSVLHTPIYRYFQNAKKQQQAAQVQEQTRRKDLQFIKNELNNVKKQLQKVKKAQVTQQVFKQSQLNKKAKKQIKISAPMAVTKTIQDLNNNDKILQNNYDRFYKKEDLNKTIDIPQNRNKHLLNNTIYSFNKQSLTNQKNRSQQSRYQSPTKAQPSNLWAILRNRALNKLNSSKKIGSKRVNKKQSSAVKQEKISNQKKQIQTQIKPQIIELNKKISDKIEKNQVKQDKKKSDIVQNKIPNKSQIVQNIISNKQEDINSNQSIKSFLLNIENITKTKKAYINYINLLAESVARTYKVIKNIQIQGLDKIVTSYFIYKRFYYQRKRIEQSLQQGKNDVLYRLSEIPLKKSLYQQWKKSDECKLMIANIKKANIGIQQTIKKMLDRVLNKQQISSDIKKYAMLQSYDIQKEQMILIEYIIREHDLLIKYEKLNDDIRIHLSQIIDSLFIILELNKRNTKYLVNLQKRKGINQYIVSYLRIQQQPLNQLRNKSRLKPNN